MNSHDLSVDDITDGRTQCRLA